MGAADGVLPGTGVRAELVSADSMQAYRGMDIGTAKAGPELLSRLPHHLLDIREPDEQYSAGDFARLALVACAEIRARGGIPVVCGGTGFYVRNFICGVPTAPAADPEMRKAVAFDLERLGIGRLREELEASDPASAGRIHGNDIYRLTRALEIIRATGKPLAEFAAGENARNDEEFLVLGIETPREELVRRIDLRVDAMFDSGLVEEFRRLSDRGYKAADPGMKAIGYREFFDPEKGSILDLHERKTLDRVRELVKLDTRRYAKRQMTFFRVLPGIVWISSDGDDLARLVRGFLADDCGGKTAP
jgi:tRNA dimethylallyltransferase